MTMFTNLKLKLYHLFEKKYREQVRFELYTRLPIIACKYEFTEADLEIKRQLIQATTSARMRRKLLQRGIHLDHITKHARVMVMADE